MAEENNQQEQPQENQEPRQFTVDEDRAMQHGWVPKDQWQGEPDEWIPAKVFNMKGELFGRIAKDKKEISELRTAVTHLVDDRKRAYEDGYKNAMTQLKAQKKEALENGDVQQVMEIDDKIEQTREDHANKKQEFERKIATTKTPDNPVFDAWHVENDWYLSSPAMTEYANELVQDMATQARTSGTQVDYPKVLQEISRRVRQKFPEKFGKRTVERPSSPVDKGSSSSDDKSGYKRQNKFSESDLSDTERKIMDTVLKTSNLTKEQYLDQVGAYAKRKGA